MNKLPLDIILEVILHLDPIDWKKMYILNKNLNKICVENEEYIAKKMLNKYNVDYQDPGNLIYVHTPYDQERSFNSILDLYTEFYIRQAIVYNNKGITSIPSLPHLEILVCCDNKIVSIGECNNLDHLSCSNNRLTHLPFFPNLCMLICDGNNLTSLPEYPKLSVLICSYNNFFTLPEYPLLQELHCNNNSIHTLPVYPNLKIKITDEYEHYYY